MNSRDESSIMIDKAITLHEQGDLAAAEKIYRNIINKDPNNDKALYLLGVVAQDTHHPHAAVKLLNKALNLNPKPLVYYFHLARAHTDLKNWRDAIRLYRFILHSTPDDVVVRINLGILLSRSGYVIEAIKHYRFALSKEPNNILARNNLALALQAKGDLDRAEEEYRRTLKFQPDYVKARDNLLFLLSYYVRCSPEDMLSAHMEWDRVLGQAGRTNGYHHQRMASSQSETNRRLRIGYVSPDMKQHSVSYFFEPLLGAHDRRQFEIYCYAEVSVGDAVTERLKAQADGWVMTVGMSDAALAERIHNDGIDILIDLAGHTAGNRLGAFTYKPAPVQATYLGYFTTTGLAAMDYWISDAVMTPADTVELSSETIWRLPRSCVVYQAPADAPAVVSRGSETITFGSFNDLSKVSGAAVRCWSEILKQVPGSRLLLKAKQLSDAGEQSKWRERFVAHGIEAERLILRARTESLAEHLALYGEVDIALDAMPRTGGTTTAEALYMGVPVISLAGERFIERLSASMLTAVELESLVVASEAAYIARAVSLAADRAGRRELRASLRERMLASPLCDAADLTRHLEQGYQKMWRDFSLR